MTSQNFIVHSLVNVQEDTNLQLIGSLTESQMKIIQDIYDSNEPASIQWPAKLNELDLAIAKQYQFDADSSVTEEDFVTFGFARSTQAKICANLLAEHFPDFSVSDIEFSVLTCSTYFAHIHDDKENVESAGQVMMILDNPANHTILSRSDSGDVTLTPKAGDIVFLNIWEKHAVLPCQSHGIDFMKNNPLKMVALAV